MITTRTVVFTAFGWRAVLLALAAIIAVGPAAGAVPPGEPSKTAIMAATFRAIGARNPDATFRNPDYLAARFLRPDDLALLAANGLDMRPQMAMTGTLRFVAEHAAPGSQIIFDYPFNTNHRIDNAPLPAPSSAAHPAEIRTRTAAHIGHSADSPSPP